MWFSKKIFSLFSVVIIIAGIFLLSVFTVQAQTSANTSCSANLEGKSNTELKIALENCEKEIKKQKGKLNNKQRESVTIERDISILNYKIAQSKSDIKVRSIKIKQIKETITQKEDKILELSKKTEGMKSSIAGLLRKSDELQSQSLVETLLSNKTLSEFLINIDNLNVLKNELRSSLSSVKKIKDEINATKVDLQIKEGHEQGLKLTKERKQKQTISYKYKKQRLLNLNKKKEAEYKATILQQEKIRNKIRNRIFRTVGGTEMTFNDALQILLPFEDKIGVETALVLAVLTQESAVNGVIGRNLGKCTYNERANNRSGTVMSSSQKQSFLAIVNELGMDPSTTPVSCPISRDGQYGGAIGPSQFMPNTWWNIRSGYGYKKRVAKVLGTSSPSPFVNLDAFVGTALYLSDARKICAGPRGFSKLSDVWSCTAAKYYSGLQSRGSRLYKHMRPKYSYGYKVAQRAKGFQKDINTLGL